MYKYWLIVCGFEYYLDIWILFGLIGSLFMRHSHIHSLVADDLMTWHHHHMSAPVVPCTVNPGIEPWYVYIAREASGVHKGALLTAAVVPISDSDAGDVGGRAQVHSPPRLPPVQGLGAGSGAEVRIGVPVHGERSLGAGAGGGLARRLALG
jgi:hypothetical protein